MKASLVILALVAGVLAGCGDARQEGGGKHSGATPVDAAEVLSREPYMGVSCRTPNSFECDRVGLAVWLTDPAARIDAAIEGRGLELDDPEWSGPAEDGQRRMFAGFLQPAGLMDGDLRVTADAGTDRWIGREPVSGAVTLWIRRADGSEETLTTEVDLSAGWG